MEELKILIQANEEQEKLGNLTDIGIAYLNGLRRAEKLLETKYP